MSKGQHRRMGTTHHPPHPPHRYHPPQRRWSRCWGVVIPIVLPAVLPWPQIAMGQPMGKSADLSSVGVGEGTSPLRDVGGGMAELTQPLAPNPPADLEWGELLPSNPAAPATGTPVFEDPSPGLESDLYPDDPPGEDARDPVYLRPSEACPADYETLVTTLLRDLPQYANRVAVRSSPLPSVPPVVAANHPDPPPAPSPVGTMLIASQPDFEPMDLSDRAFGAGLDSTSDIRQVFFTTLERQYLRNQVVSLQHFHWLFLVQAEDGWRSVLLYSSLGSYPAADRRLTPPQESSQGVVGTAVRLWLRDCRAGAVFPPAATTEDETGS